MSNCRDKSVGCHNAGSSTSRSRGMKIEPRSYRRVEREDCSTQAGGYYHNSINHGPPLKYRSSSLTCGISNRSLNSRRLQDVCKFSSVPPKLTRPNSEPMANCKVGPSTSSLKTVLDRSMTNTKEQRCQSSCKEKQTDPEESYRHIKAIREKACREKVDRENASREKTDQDNAEHDKACKEKAEREKAEHDKACKEKADREKACWDTAECEKACRERANCEKKCRGNADCEKKCREKADCERKCREKAECVKKCRAKAGCENKCREKVGLDQKPRNKPGEGRFCFTTERKPKTEVKKQDKNKKEPKTVSTATDTSDLSLCETTDDKNNRSNENHQMRNECSLNPPNTPCRGSQSSNRCGKCFENEERASPEKCSQEPYGPSLYPIYPGQYEKPLVSLPGPTHVLLLPGDINPNETTIIDIVGLDEGDLEEVPGIPPHAPKTLLEDAWKEFMRQTLKQDLKWRKETGKFYYCEKMVNKRRSKTNKCNSSNNDNYIGQGRSFPFEKYGNVGVVDPNNPPYKGPSFMAPDPECQRARPFTYKSRKTVVRPLTDEEKKELEEAQMYRTIRAIIESYDAKWERDRAERCLSDNDLMDIDAEDAVLEGSPCKAPKDVFESTDNCVFKPYSPPSLKISPVRSPERNRERNLIEWDDCECQKMCCDNCNRDKVDYLSRTPPPSTKCQSPKRSTDLIDLRDQDEDLLGIKSPKKSAKKLEDRFNLCSPKIFKSSSKNSQASQTRRCSLPERPGTASTSPKPRRLSLSPQPIRRSRSHSSCSQSKTPDKTSPLRNSDNLIQWRSPVERSLPFDSGCEDNLFDSIIRTSPKSMNMRTPPLSSWNRKQSGASSKKCDSPTKTNKRRVKAVPLRVGTKVMVLENSPLCEDTVMADSGHETSGNDDSLGIINTDDEQCFCQDSDDDVFKEQPYRLSSRRASSPNKFERKSPGGNDLGILDLECQSDFEYARDADQWLKNETICGRMKTKSDEECLDDVPCPFSSLEVIEKNECHESKSPDQSNKRCIESFGAELLNQFKDPLETCADLLGITEVKETQDNTKKFGPMCQELIESCPDEQIIVDVSDNIQCAQSSSMPPHRFSYSIDLFNNVNWDPSMLCNKDQQKQEVNDVRSEC